MQIGSMCTVKNHFQTCMQAVPLPLCALDESFHAALPSTVSAPILDSKPGQEAAALSARHLNTTVSAKFLKSHTHLILRNFTQMLSKENVAHFFKKKFCV